MARFPLDTLGMVRKYLKSADGSPLTALSRNYKPVLAVSSEPSAVSQLVFFETCPGGSYFDELAIFFTIASTSFRSLSFRLAE